MMDGYGRRMFGELGELSKRIMQAYQRVLGRRAGRLDLE